MLPKTFLHGDFIRYDDFGLVHVYMSTPAAPENALVTVAKDNT